MRSNATPSCCAMSVEITNRQCFKLRHLVMALLPVRNTFGRAVAKTCSLPPVPPLSSCMHASTAPPRQESIAVCALKSSGIWPSRVLTCSQMQAQEPVVYTCSALSNLEPEQARAAITLHRLGNALRQQIVVLSIARLHRTTRSRASRPMNCCQSRCPAGAASHACSLS